MNAKVHYRVTSPITDRERRQWEAKGLIPGAVRLCDLIAINKGDEFYFTTNDSSVTCKNCRNKRRRHKGMQ